MKKFAAVILAVMLMIPAMALCQGPVLLMQMPEGVQMVENVAFDDGDFIQTYQSGGATVYLLRYAAFDMTLEDMLASEWPGQTDVSPLTLESVGGCPAQGLSLRANAEGTGDVDVTAVMVDYGAGKLVFEAVVPAGDEEAAAAVRTMLETMDVLMDSAQNEAEVG